MKIAVRYKGDALVSDSRGRCREVDRCGAPGALCELNICTSDNEYKLERHLGPHVWSRVAEGLPEETEVLVLFEGDIYRAVPEFGGCIETCDCYRKELCRRHCEALDKKALCQILGAFFGVKQVAFKRVNV